jgi:hypothetical protein
VMRDLREHGRRDADDRPVPGAQQSPPAGAPLCPPRHLSDVRGRGPPHGLHPCRRRRDGAVELPRRPSRRTPLASALRCRQRERRPVDGVQRRRCLARRVKSVPGSSARRRHARFRQPGAALR